MAMVICFTMLLGTTFAWFTDNEAVQNNVITAGTLDVELDATAVNLNNVEPGYVHIQQISIKNVGSLDFNYKLAIKRTTVPASAKDLADVIDVYYFTGAVNPTRSEIESATSLGKLSSLIDGVGDDFFGARSLDDHTDESITLVYVVPTSVNNDYQASGAGTFDIRVLAAQKASESDSIGTDYDNGAEYDA
jgi:predicted ribosomally synthesized peptide with SipW-like signal peptide